LNPLKPLKLKFTLRSHLVVIYCPYYAGLKHIKFTHISHLDEISNINYQKCPILIYNNIKQAG